MSHDNTRRNRAKPGQLCPRCKRSESCSWDDSGYLLCKNWREKIPGWVMVWNPPAGSEFGGFRTENDPLLYKNNGNGHSPEPKKGGKKKGLSEEKRLQLELQAERYAAKVSPEKRQELAELLGLPANVLDLLPLLGWSEVSRIGPCWTWAELDGEGRICGIGNRNAKGDKGVMYGSDPGLVIPKGCLSRPGPVYVVEGMSCTMMLTAIGLAAIGRPSANYGMDKLAHYLKRSLYDRHTVIDAIAGELAGKSLDQQCNAAEETPSGRSAGNGQDAGQASALPRPIFVIAENDIKPNRQWPGLDGGEATVAALEEALGRKVSLFLPPLKYKDSREFVTSLKPYWGEGQDLDKLTADYREGLKLVPVAQSVQQEDQEELVTVTAEDEEDEVFDWFVPARIAADNLNAIAGDGGSGKSQIALHIAARATRGECCFDLDYEEPVDCDVLVANGEDKAGATSKPRLRAQHADLRRIHFLKGKKDKEGKLMEFDLTQVPALRQKLERNPAIKLVIIDPITAYYGESGISGNNDAELRRLLNPLRTLAFAMKVTFIFVVHYNKSTAPKAANRVAGTAGLRNLFRSLWLVVPYPRSEGKWLLDQDKVNDEELQNAFIYGIRRLTDGEAGPIVSDLSHWPHEKLTRYKRQLVRAEFEGETDLTANQVCEEEAAQAQEVPGQLREAMDELRSYLKNGCMVGTECIETCNRALGITRGSKWWRVKVLQDGLGGHVIREQCEKPRSFWCLPGQTIQTIPADNSTENAVFQQTIQTIQTSPGDTPPHSVDDG